MFAALMRLLLSMLAGSGDSSGSSRSRGGDGGGGGGGGGDSSWEPRVRPVSFWLSHLLVVRFKSEHPAVDLTVASQVYTMQSILEILVVNVKSGTSKKTGQPYSIPEAQCILRNDDNSVAAVGVLIIPKALEDAAKPGLYTGSFALQAEAFGADQGRIVARLVGLTPIVSGRARPAGPAVA